MNIEDITWNEKIRNMRRRAKKNQSVFAKEIGISRKHLSLLEKGVVDPKKSLMEKIASNIGQPVPVIFGSGTNSTLWR